MMPALFIGHGSPMNALGNNEYSRAVSELGLKLPKPRAILAISAHWETSETEVLDLNPPPTIHDFYGFPPELFRISYPAPGAPELARRVNLLCGAQLSKSWGLDHGTWSVLRHLFPLADIPVTQLSLSRKLDFAGHMALAEKLRPLRAEQVLIVASGNIVHNLREISWSEESPPFAWASEFDQRLAQALQVRDLKVLLEFKGLEAQLVRRAVPTSEHYVPLIYAAGASTADEVVHFPFTAIQNGSIAMRSVQFGG